MLLWFSLVSCDFGTSYCSCEFEFWVTSEYGCLLSHATMSFYFLCEFATFQSKRVWFKCGMRVWVLIGQASMGFRPHATLVLSFHASFGLQKFKRVWVWSKSCDFSFFLHTMRVWNLRPSEYGFWSSEYRFRVTLVSSDSSFASFINWG